MMQKSLPTPFPRGVDVSSDANPAIRLFGKRFYVDQPIPEFLVEFLLVVSSTKSIGERYQEIRSALPTLEQIRNWPESVHLAYEPEIRLNLKLFSFLSSSRVDSRHEIHRQQFELIWTELKSRVYSSKDDADDVVEWLEDLLRGFRGAGLNRTWCAQSFFPVATSLLTPETIWNETKVKNNPVNTWKESLDEFSVYYSVSRHNFLARGGEVLYLQLCNVFAQEQKDIAQFARSFQLSERERNLETLHEDLELGLELLYGKHDEVINNLVEYIESVDPDTAVATHEATYKRGRGSTCEWCPQDSWREGYLFAVELKRLLLTALDPIEKLELMMTGCVLQVLRTICAQSARYSTELDNVDQGPSRQGYGGGLHYSCIFTPITNHSRHLLLTSRRNLQTVLTLVQQAVRADILIKNALEIEQKKQKRKPRSQEDMLKEADDKYGYKLFRALGKKLGIIVPYKGPGARFVMTDGLLRYFILTLLEPGDSCSYDGFLDRLYANHGVAVEGRHLRDGIEWSQLPPNLSTEHDDSSWFSEMLRAGGFLTELSDGLSIVTNTFQMIQMKEGGA